MFDQHFKCKQIARRLAELKLPVPKTYFINNELAKLCKNKFGPTSLSLGDLENWTKQHIAIPDSEGVAYVGGEYINAETPVFRIFVTSKRLLKNAVGAKWLCADPTYKLTWQGFPSLVVGTTDRDRKFHMVGISLCTGETADDFKFTFQSILNATKVAYGKYIDPSALVCDAAKGIHKAFKAVFGEKMILMCWAHMRKKLKKSSLIK